MEKILFNFEEMLCPVWQGEISYKETAMPLIKEDGEIEPIQLLYPIEEVIEVKNATLSETYSQGKDYDVIDGRLIINKDGRIRTTPQKEVVFNEGSWYHERQIVVTYKHSRGYEGYIPSKKGRMMGDIHEKLIKKQEIELLVFGDSISYGANSSGCKDVNASPYLPTYAEMFAKGIELRYGVKVKLTNPSVGGKDSAWGLSEIDRVLSEQTGLDLAVIAFGMNDINLQEEEYVTTIEKINRKILEVYPCANIMVVAPMLPNKKIDWVYKNQTRFYMFMGRLEREGVTVVNMTSMHECLLQRKAYTDMTGNNINHPNDYLARVYAQVLLETLDK